MQLNDDFRSQVTNTQTTNLDFAFSNDLINILISKLPTATKQVKSIAPKFKGRTPKESARKIWNFLKQNISYKIDPDMDQYIRLPARFVADAVGDCKSYTLFTGAILNALKIPFSFRFAGYDGNTIPSHVYTVAHTPSGDVIIDGVYHRFDAEKKPNFKKDKKLRVHTLGNIPHSPYTVASPMQNKKNFIEVRELAFNMAGTKDPAMVEVAAEFVRHDKNGTLLTPSGQHAKNAMIYASKYKKPSSGQTSTSIITGEKITLEDAESGAFDVISELNAPLKMSQRELVQKNVGGIANIMDKKPAIKKQFLRKVGNKGLNDLQKGLRKAPASLIDLVPQKIGSAAAGIATAQLLMKYGPALLETGKSMTDGGGDGMSFDAFAKKAAQGGGKDVGKLMQALKSLFNKKEKNAANKAANRAKIVAMIAQLKSEATAKYNAANNTNKTQKELEAAQAAKEGEIKAQQAKERAAKKERERAAKRAAARAKEAARKILEASSPYRLANLNKGWNERTNWHIGKAHYGELFANAPGTFEDIPRAGDNLDANFYIEKGLANNTAKNYIIYMIDKMRANTINPTGTDIYNENPTIKRYTDKVYNTLTGKGGSTGGGFKIDELLPVEAGTGNILKIGLGLAAIGFAAKKMKLF